MVSWLLLIADRYSQIAVLSQFVINDCLVINEQKYFNVYEESLLLFPVHNVSPEITSKAGSSWSNGN